MKKEKIIKFIEAKLLEEKNEIAEPQQKMRNLDRDGKTFIRIYGLPARALTKEAPLVPNIIQPTIKDQPEDEKPETPPKSEPLTKESKEDVVESKKK